MRQRGRHPPCSGSFFCHANGAGNPNRAGAVENGLVCMGSGHDAEESDHHVDEASETVTLSEESGSGDACRVIDCHGDDGGSWSAGGGDCDFCDLCHH